MVIQWKTKITHCRNAQVQSHTPSSGWSKCVGKHRNVQHLHAVLHDKHFLHVQSQVSVSGSSNLDGKHLRMKHLQDLWCKCLTFRCCPAYLDPPNPDTCTCLCGKCMSYEFPCKCFTFRCCPTYLDPQAPDIWTCMTNIFYTYSRKYRYLVHQILMGSISEWNIYKTFDISIDVLYCKEKISKHVIQFLSSTRMSEWFCAQFSCFVQALQYKWRCLTSFMGLSLSINK
jgi:hypothetical protein